jgi:hypothetical protein
MLSQLNRREMLGNTAAIGAALWLTGTGIDWTKEAFAAEPSPAAADPFSFDGSKNIREEAHFGIVNGKLTCGIPYQDAFAVRGLWAPPYVSTDFRLDIKLFNQSLATNHYTWHPFYVERSGSVQGIGVKSLTMLVPGSRAGLMQVTLKNTSAEPRTIPVALAARGTLDLSKRWEFRAPRSKTATKASFADGTLRLEQGKQAIVLRADAALRWNDARPDAGGSISLPPSGEAKFCVVYAVGPSAEAQSQCEKIVAAPEQSIAGARAAYADRVRDLYQKLPQLESSSPELKQLYDRSLVHLLMNRWDVPEFVLHPYYSTGSVNGGCVCDYLYNFGENWEIFPLYDAAANREHIKQFLSIDIAQHYAFEPTTGNAFGPWYMVNMEKIIGLIYFHVFNTGDREFLREKINGKTVLQHVFANATQGDDLAKPVALIDYGPSNSHLELRRGLPYNHVMPDLNGRRYQNYVLAAELAELSGERETAAQLRRRAEDLKAVLKATLWNKNNRWFDFQDDKGKKETRYTVQMFKLFGSKVLDDEEEAGLLGHLLSEKEFLSEFGLHSMAKGDPAYDPADVDNGGPGCCTCFPPQIAERLYKAGKPAAAEAILQRILWWGERMPYWGDSIVADKIDYRRDTPLQCTIDGATVAQCIIFGLFGVRAELNGDVRIHPQPPSFARQITLRGLRFRGRVLDIAIEGNEYEVRDGDRRLRSTVGRPIVLPAAR